MRSDDSFASLDMDNRRQLNISMLGNAYRYRDPMLNQSLDFVSSLNKRRNTVLAP